MDSKTHIQFAHELMRLSKNESFYKAASLFPQIDRNPSVFHRLYAHTTFRAREICTIGFRELAGQSQQSKGYLHRRFREDASRVLDYLDEAERLTLKSTSQAFNMKAAIVSFISHLYLDTYNQPTQPFAPTSVYCSGQWKIWEEVGDFRERLYLTDLIHELRSELFEGQYWKTSPGTFSCEALIYGQILRLVEHGEGKIDPKIIPPVMHLLEIEIPASQETAAVSEFLVGFEAHLYELHRKHLASN